MLNGNKLHINSQAYTSDKWITKAICLTGFLVLCFAAVLIIRGKAYADQVIPFVSVDLGYTDNARFLAVARESGFIRVSPGVRLVMGKPENRFTARGHINYDYYFDISEYTRIEGGALNLGYTYAESPKWIFDITNSFTSTYDSPILDDENRLVRLETVEGRRDRNATTVRLTHNFGPDDSVYAGYSYIFNDYTEENFDSNRIHSPLVGGKWRFSPDWRVEAEGAAKRSEYDETPTIDNVRGTVSLVRLIGPTKRASVTLSYNQAIANTEDTDYSDSRDYRTYSAQLGWSQDLDPTFSYGLAAGVSKVYRADTPAYRNADDTFPILNAWLTWRGETWRLGFNTSTSLGEYDLYGSNAGLTFTHRVSATFAYDFDPHWTLVLRGAFIKDTYKQDPDFTTSEFRGDVDNVSLGSTLRWTMTRHFSLSLDYRYLYQDQEDLDTQRRQNRVMLILTGEYPYRW